MVKRRRTRGTRALRIAPLPGTWETHGAYSLIQAAADGTLDLRSRDWLLVKSSAHKLARDQGKDSFADLSWPRALLTEQAAFKSVAAEGWEGQA